VHKHLQDASHRGCNTKILATAYVFKCRLPVILFLLQRLELWCHICLLFMAVHVSVSLCWCVKLSYFGSEPSLAKSPFSFVKYLNIIDIKHAPKLLLCFYPLLQWHTVCSVGERSIYLGGANCKNCHYIHTVSVIIRVCKCFFTTHLVVMKGFKHWK
jgi:hypothetical protein